MPVTPPPPAQPPVIIQQPSQPPVVVQQQQQQQQTPVYVPVGGGTAADLMSESTSSNDSRSSSDSSSVNSAAQQNIQYNSSSNRVEVDGIKIPTTTLNLYGGVNDNGYSKTTWNAGAQISISLDGKGRANRMLEKRIKITQLQYERELAGACASIDKDNYEVNPNSPVATELAQCNTIIRARKQVAAIAPRPVAQPVVHTEISQLRQENAELRQQLALILQKLDNQKSTVKNGGF